ncbi:MAG TPA: helix-turn-helix domain-containing protein [Paludibacter sp.]
MKTILTTILFTISFSLFSQNTKIDSLQQKLTQTKGNEKILLLNDLANEYGYVDFNKSISLAKEALRLAVIQKFNITKARSYNIIGRAYFISNNYKVADAYYNKGIATATKYNTQDDIYKALRLKTLLYINGYIPDSIEAKEVFKRYINLTIEKNSYIDFTESLKILIYVYQSQPSNSSFVKEYLAELKNRTKKNTEFLAAISAGEAFICEQNLEYFCAIQKYDQASKLTNDIAIKVTHLERIGVIYFDTRKYDLSVYYYNDALQLVDTHEFESKNFMKYLLEADLGASYLQLKKYSTAIFSLQKALQCQTFSKRDKGTIYNNIGTAYLFVDSLDQADLYINKAISMLDAINNVDVKLAFLNTKAELLIKKEQWIKLAAVINEISKLVNKVQDYYIVDESYQILSNYYQKAGNFKKSNEYLKKLITANDSISNREFVTKMSEFQFKYQTEKKEQQIALQQDIIKNRNQLLVFVVIAGSIILAALLVIFILYRIRNKAYKLLVYQSMEYKNSAQLIKIEENTDEEDTIEIKNGNSALDKELKIQIEISLNKQLDIKVYLKPNLILKTLAEKCNTNRSYLSQFINERYNMNFNTFINELRISEAKRILSDKNNDLPLKELYIRLGFSTYSVFNEAFKKHIGVTPAFYLKTVKDLIDK